LQNDPTKHCGTISDVGFHIVGNRNKLIALNEVLVSILSSLDIVDVEPVTRVEYVNAIKDAGLVPYIRNNGRLAFVCGDRCGIMIVSGSELIVFFRITHSPNFYYSR
jgi:hypothetical protein